MTTTPTEATVTTTISTERIHLDHGTTKRLGNWTTASAFQVHVRKGSAVLDLRSPAITGDIDLDLELQGSVLVLLLPDDAAVDQRGLGFTGRGKVKDDQKPGSPNRRIQLRGSAANSQIRVRRGGSAQVTAMLSREYADDLRAAHREGRMPIVDDPAREAARSLAS
jgi:hypothetical protein